MTDAEGKVKQIEVEAVVIRKDGAREDLGTVAYWHRSRFRRALARARGLGRVQLNRER